ncbi:alpha/beta hydrolase [Oscillospiraceae bacterium PP1C4]
MVKIAINKAVLAALKALSYPDIDIKKNYKIKRQLEVAAGLSINPFYKPWDHKVDCGDHEIPVRIFSPETEGEHAILLFFHGGGWVTGNIDSYDKVCSNMAKMTGHIVVSVDYRLAPEHPFPAAPEDCYTVAREVYLDASLFGVRPNQITLIGDSAGGNLAAAVSLMARDRGEFLPARQILIYPAVNNDHSATSPFPSVHENATVYLLTSKRVCDYMDLYLSCEADHYSPYFAPLLASDFSNQPDTLIITAEYDPLRDEGEAYAQRLREAGNHVKLQRIPDALHGFFSLPPRFTQVKEAYALINAFLSEGEGI